MTLYKIGDLISRSGVTVHGKTESPIEEIFAREISSKVKPEVKATTQYELTACGISFRMDFVLEYEGRKIGIECDGKEFHNYAKDLWRDAIILGDEKLDAIYRFSGKEIIGKIDACIYIMYFNDREFFDAEKVKILEYSLTDSLFREQPKMLMEDIIVTDEFEFCRGVKHEKTLTASRRTKDTRKSKMIFDACRGLTANTFNEMLEKVKVRNNSRT